MLFLQHNCFPRHQAIARNNRDSLRFQRSVTPDDDCHRLQVDNPMQRNLELVNDDLKEGAIALQQAAVTMA